MTTCLFHAAECNLPELHSWRRFHDRSKAAGNIIETGNLIVAGKQRDTAYHFQAAYYKNPLTFNQLPS